MTIPAGDFTVSTEVSILIATPSALTGVPGGATAVTAVGVVIRELAPS